MNTSGRMLYPMLAVGAFMVMFWSGVVVGYELGLSCLPLLAAGLASACLGGVLVAELERRAAGDYRRRSRTPARPARGDGAQSADLPTGARLRAEPWSRLRLIRSWDARIAR